MPQSLEDIWSEIYFMDFGYRLGGTISKFREEFMLPGRCLPGRNYPYEWIPKADAKDRIYKSISDLVISMDNDVLNLPDVTYNNIYAYMDDTEAKVYRDMMKHHILQYGNSLDDVVTAESPGVLAGKLMQLASGNFYTDKNGTYLTLHKRKLEVLQYIYDNEPSPLLVAYHFKFDIDMIKSQFPDAVVFDGSLEMRQDWNNGKIRMLLIQPASAGFGLNFQMGGHTLVWYTLTWNLEEYIQTNARLHRQGQSEPVMIHHIMTKNTIDARIINALHHKDVSQDALLAAVECAIQDADEYEYYEDEIGAEWTYPT